MDKNKDAIRAILSERRRELGYTMKDVAKLVGVSEATISRWESGDIANMRRDRISKLADALKISPAVIMGWEETSSSSAAIPVPAVDPNEEQLIAMYRELNSAGQKKLREYAEDLIDNDKYKKDSKKNAVVG